MSALANRRRRPVRDRAIAAFLAAVAWAAAQIIGSQLSAFLPATP
jgi:uncharacterized BrkB/YihY/UPF0761 family membrane protein